MTPSELWGPNGPQQNTHSEKIAEQCVCESVQSCMLNLIQAVTWISTCVELLISIIIMHLLTWIFIITCHNYILHQYSVYVFYINTWQKQLFPLLFLHLSLSLSVAGLWSLAELVPSTPDTESETCDWMITRAAGLSRPTKSLCIPSQNSWGWLSISSNRSPGCLLIFHKSPDAVISLGDSLCILMLKANIQRASRPLVL